LSFITLIWLSVVTTLAVLGAVWGLWLADSPERSRGILTFSGGLLVGIALFWVLPELGGQLPMWAAGGFLLAGFAVLWLINRYLYPVCPSCSHDHDHQHCDTRLHGFGVPLVIAALVHSTLDGWGIGMSQGREGELGAAFLVGALVHKIPEGLAYGSILRASMRTRTTALFWVVLIEGMTIVGGLAALVAAPYLSPAVLGAILSLAGGTFLYLGAHAVHIEWKRRGKPAVYPALTGAAGAAALQHGLRVLLR
jgi:zinc transporter ZupT